MFSEGFKALDPIDVDLNEKLLFLVGVNGAGKSSTLQALAFVQFFASGQPNEFFSERNWNAADVRSRTVVRDHNTIRYHLLFECGDELLLWQFAWGVTSKTNIAEQMWISSSGAPPKLLFTFGKQRGLSKGTETIKGLTPVGSILNVMDPSALTERHEVVRSVLDWARRITSLELLSPQAMRGSARGSAEGIGARGQRLAGFLALLDAKSKARIVDRLADFYPLDGLTTTRKKAGWVDLRISEKYEIGSISSQHVSDGFLRLLALCAIPEFGSQASLVLLDEIEDGIEPHILPRLIERIVKDSSAQFVMTSHSPLLINFFDPNDVVLVTRSKEGRSRFVRLSEIEAFKSGLEYFGPGEIWANTGLQTLSIDAQSVVERQLASNSEGEVNRFSVGWVREFMSVQ